MENYHFFLKKKYVYQIIIIYYNNVLNFILNFLKMSRLNYPVLKIFYSNIFNLNIKKKQFFFTYSNNYLNSIWTISNGIILKKLFHIEKKKLKKKAHMSYNFLKQFLLNSVEYLTKNEIYILYIKGLFFFFLKFFIFLQKTNFITNFHLLILRPNLSHIILKKKKIKAIKRTLLKRLLAIHF